MTPLSFFKIDVKNIQNCLFDLGTNLLDIQKTLQKNSTKGLTSILRQRSVQQT